MTTVRKVRNRLKKLLPSYHSLFVIRKCDADESRVEIFINFTNLTTINDTKELSKTLEWLIHNINQFVSTKSDDIIKELNELKCKK